MQLIMELCATELKRSFRLYHVEHFELASTDKTEPVATLAFLTELLHIVANLADAEKFTPR